MHHYTVSPEDSGKRLDQYIAVVKPDLTRNFIQKMIKDGNVFVNNKKITKTSTKVKEEDKLLVMFPALKEVGIEAEDIPLDILFEDDDIIVLNKAPGMVMHPTDHGAHVSGTIVNAVLHHAKDSLSGINGEKRPGIVHRLDKFTSGAVIIAKNDKAHSHVAKQIEARTVTKKYTTLLKGHLQPKEGSIEAPLLVAHGAQEVKVSNSQKAKYALTHYEVQEYVGDYSLVEVTIVTGRTHQIRVHFNSIGHPVCGDETYGNDKVNAALKEKGLNRQFLHAAYLEFKHPTTEKTIKIKAPLPKDLKDVVKALKG